MIDYISQNLWLLWLIAFFVCLIIEVSSGTFYIMCFAIGMLAAMVSSWLSVPFWLQVVIFALFTVVSIFCVRPLALKWFHKGADDRLSNFEALIGRQGVVIEPIEAGKSGYVKVDGDEWKAVSTVGDTIKVGERVRIVKMESIIVTVERV